MAEIEIKSLVKLFTILLLNEKEQHGYEIMKGVEKRIGRKASPGQIYPFLKQLERYGYVYAGGREERDKRVYHITPEGKKFVMRVSDRFGDLFDIAIKPKLTKCAHCGCEIYKGAYRKKVGSRYMSFCCENCAKSYKPRNKF